MTYTLFILRRAQKELSAVPSPHYERIKDAIQALSEDPRPPGCKKLKAREGWCVRIGDYRVIYEIDDGSRELLVLSIGHRGRIYD